MLQHKRTFRSGLVLGVAAYKQGVAESVYDSNTREPLGKGYNRGHVLPQVVERPDFPGTEFLGSFFCSRVLVMVRRGLVDVGSPLEEIMQLSCWSLGFRFVCVGGSRNR